LTSRLSMPPSPRGRKLLIRTRTRPRRATTARRQRLRTRITTSPRKPSAPRSFRPADQDLQFWWEGAVRCTFAPKLEIFTAVFHRHARDRADRCCDRARIAAANTRDSRGPQAECPEDPDSQRSLIVHARTAATWVTAIRARRPSARLRRQRTRSNQEWRRPLCALRSAARPSFASFTTGPQCRRHGRRGEAT